MDNILKQEMENLKREMSDNGVKLDELSELVRDMSFALMGNKFTKDGGIGNEHIQLKAEVAVLRKRVEVLEAEKGKNDVYVKTLWIIVGAVGSSVLYMVMNIIFKK
jgi:uncharacterized protein YydD (DUF2326 family)